MAPKNTAKQEAPAPEVKEVPVVVAPPGGSASVKDDGEGGLAVTVSSGTDAKAERDNGTKAPKRVEEAVAATNQNVKFQIEHR